MLKVRVIPCLDVKDGRVVKGVNFVDLRDAGDPVACAIAYDPAGADELCFLDITASHENRSTLLDVVRRTAEACFMPLTVGGGVRRSRTFETCCSPAPTRSRSIRRPCRPRLRQGRRGKIRQPVRRRGDRRQARLRPARLAALGNLHPRRPAATGIDAIGLRARGRRARRGRNPADLDGPRRRQERLRPRSHPRGRRCRRVPVIASGGVGNLDHLVDGVRRATPARCSPPRSSISANTRSGRPRHMAAAGLPMRMD